MRPRAKFNAILIASLVIYFITISSAYADWKPAGNMPNAAAKQAAILTNDTVLISGGYDGTNYLSSTEVYNTSWASGPALNFARSNHTATLLNDGRVLVVGGYNRDLGYLEYCEIFNGTSWQNLTDSPLQTKRAYHTATKLPDGRVVIAGGVNSTGYLNACEIYNPNLPTANKWKTAASLNQARVFHTATLLADGRILVAGGYNLSGYLDSAEIYDPQNNTWTEVAPMKVKRHSHKAVLLTNGRVLVTGGISSGTYLNSSEIYDPLTNQWTLYDNSLYGGRYAHSMTVLKNGKVLIAGGAGNSGELSSAVIYDPSSDSFTKVGEMTTPRSYHTATLLSNGDILVAGGINSGKYLDSSEIYRDGSTVTLGSLSGEVTDSLTGSLVPGATVTMGIYGTVTNTSGIYSFTDIVPGNYTITVSKNGYDLTSQAVSIKEGNNETLNLQLSPPDLTAPTITVKTGLPEILNTLPLTLEGSVSDLQNNIKRIEYSLNGSDWLPAVARDGSLDSRSEEFTLTLGALTDGDYTLRIKTEDQKGNIKEISFTFTVNLAGPALTVKIDEGKGVSSSSSNYGIVSTNPKLEISAEDKNGLASILILINGNEVEKQMLKDNPQAYSYSYTIPDSKKLNEGTNTITVVSYDAKGSSSSLDLTVEAYSGDLAVIGTPYAYPNPYKPSSGTLKIAYSLTESADIDLYIYDITGRRVAKMTLPYEDPASPGQFGKGGRKGDNKVEWNGTSDFGEVIGNGVYVYFISKSGKTLGSGEFAVYE